MKPLTISAVQFDIFWEQPEKNRSYLESQIQSLKTSQIIVFPEMFSTGFSMNTQLAEQMDGSTFQWMQEMAKKYKKILVGSIIIQENENYYNRLICMLPNGQYSTYDKRHLFSYASEDKYFTAGNKRLIISVNGWSICLQICYDLRFPVWARQAHEPYDILINIANWPEKRIHAWKTLLQARAIENQTYVIGVNRVGRDSQDIYYSGNSCILDPLGNALMEEEKNEAILTHTFLREDLEQIRAKFPFLEDRDQFIII